MNVVKRTWWSRILFGLLGTFVAIQLVPYGRDHTNPPIAGEPAWDAPATRTLVKQACFDCHSNETKWPLYASIAPASWLVQYCLGNDRRPDVARVHELAEVARRLVLPLRAVVADAVVRSPGTRKGATRQVGQ